MNKYNDFMNTICIFLDIYREELQKCQDVIESLEHQIEDVRKQIEIDETNQYM